MLFYYLLLGIGLSMDAFSLAIAYGTNNIKNKTIIFLSIFVGIMHFIMPNIGGLLRSIIVFDLSKYTDIVVAIIFLILTMEMIISIKDEENTSSINTIFDILLFSVAVSLDSLMVGIALSLEKGNIILAGLIFCIVSFIFTISGLSLGNFFSKRAGKLSKIIGIIILIVISLKYLLDWQVLNNQSS